MSDVLQNWHQLYLQALQQNIPHETALARAGKSETDYQNDLTNNAAFKNAVALVDAGVGATEITAKQLLQLRQAGVDEKRAAAFFGLEAPEFRTKVDAAEDLKRIWNTGHLRGEAQLMMTQHAVALMGSESMLMWQGKQRLDQKDKMEHGVDMDSVDRLISALEAKLGSAGLKGLDKPVLEAEYTEIEPLALTVDEESPKTE